jgi:MFS family permease
MQPGSGVEYMPNTSDPNYWNNWYVQMDMACINLFYVGLIYTVMRITEGCVGIMLSGITDRIGRRKSAQIFLLVNLLAQAVIIFVPTYYGKLLGYIIYACGNTKNSIAFVWMFELVETKYKSACCSAINVVDTLTMVVVGFYILFVSRNWFPIEFAIFVVSLINYACMCFLMPESPKWLLITGRVDKAITEFNYIAKVNGSL